MPAPRSDLEWIADLRARSHEQRAALDGLRLLYEQLRQEVDVLRQHVSQIATANEIAREVERRLERSREARHRGLLEGLTAAQRVAAIAFACVQLAVLVLAARGR